MSDAPNAAADWIYQCKNLSHHYKLGGSNVESLKDLSFKIKANDFVTIVGPSGSGKSTLLNLLGLIEPLQSGSIIFQNSEVGNLTESEKNKLRKYQLGFIFQNFHLIDVLTAEENVGFFLSRQGVAKAERQSLIENALNLVQLWEHRKKKPKEMSGGQRQRVAIARAIAKRPQVIIADEPTANLDQKTGHSIISILKELTQKAKLKR